ncbi:MAG: type IX secretion system sortase PorU [Calditrichaeota bacterium]|nr:type IX secretion system sortase PorU [Calditrichota bacterium]
MKQRVLVFFLTLLSLTLPFSLRASVRVVSQTDRQLVVQIDFDNWRVDSLVTQNGKLYLFAFSGAQLVGETGQPQIPVQTFLVGTPQGAEVQVTPLSIVQGREMRGTTLAPQPELRRDPKLGTVLASYLPDREAYSGKSWWPQSPVLNVHSGLIRQQPVARVSVAGLRFLPAERRVQLYRQITLKIEFSGGRSTRPAVGAPGVDPFLEDVLLNPAQARAWRVPLPKTLRKPLRRLTTGPWYKLTVRKDGFYKVDGKALQAAGVDLGDIDVKTLRLYNNGGRELPRPLSAPRPDSLIENAIIVVDGGDNHFDPDDYILFYGRGVSGWEYDQREHRFRHYINHYTYDNIYWLTWGGDRPGKRMQRIPSAHDRADLPLFETYREREFLEEELENPLHSGLDWLGRKFSNSPGGRVRDFSLDWPGAVPADTVDVRVRVASSVSTTHTFRVYLNNHLVGSTSFRAYSSPDNKRVEYRTIEASRPNLAVDGTNTLTIEYAGQSDVSESYLDWYELEYGRRLEARDNQLTFTLPRTSPGLRARLTGFSAQDVRLFDVTRFYDVREITGFSHQGSTVVFGDTTSGEVWGKRYVAVTPDHFLKVEKISKDKPSDLRQRPRQADMIIIAHDDFENQAMQLKSLHENNSVEPLKTEVVLISDVFDEFSWGLLDPTAIRDFLRFAYLHWGQPRYVLLMGDGDYDYKNLISSLDQNWIPPYETTETDEQSNRTTDDWFTYVSGNDDLMDMAIGRLPVRSPEEAQAVVDKLISYVTQPEYGAWKNTLTMVADDELVGGGVGNEVIHTTDAEYVAENYFPKLFDVQKVYLMEYPAVLTAAYAGVTKPKATEALLDRINRGTLLLNFVGHGAPRLWTHERVLLASRDFELIQNGRRQALWVAATCDFGRFDDPREQSLSEDLVNVEGRGAIGVVSSTRLAFAGLNTSFNRRFVKHLFLPYGDTGLTTPVGRAVMLAKLDAGNSLNDQKYNLLGDPALRIAAPQLRVNIVDFEPDSIKALSRMTIHGSVVRPDGQPLADPDGRVLVTVFDSKKLRTYVTAAGTRVQYYLPGNAIFRGVARVENGRFTSQFVVPKDITYGGKLGRIEAYYWTDEKDGNGFVEGIPVGGTSTKLVDTEGPTIRVLVDGRELAPGDPLPLGAQLVVQLTDSVSGINLTGDIGHKITIAFDSEDASPQDVTDRFQYFEGSYVAGQLQVPVSGLEPGSHTLRVKAWDNSNNSSTLVMDVEVVTSDELAIRDALNYPNPFADETMFTFMLTQDATVTLQVFTIGGRKVVEIGPLACVRGYTALPWDGLDAEGDELANGVYLYRIVARTEKAKAETIGKLVIAR